MKKIFVGQFISTQESMLDERISQAGNNYQLKFINILTPAHSISIVPFFFNNFLSNNNLPANASLVYAKNAKNRSYKYLFTTIKSFKIIRSMKPESIWFYNLNLSFMLLFILVKCLTRAKTFIVVADFVEPHTILQRFINFLISRSDGCIVLNRNIVNKLSVKTKILPGIVEESAIILKKGEINKNILFSGSLAKTTGLELILEFARNNADYNLYISGRKYDYSDEEFEDLQRKNMFDNIHFLGLIAYDEYIEVAAKCTFAFSLRDINDTQHDFNFPSKILEYFSKGLIVISSINYADLDPNTYFRTVYTSEGIRELLVDINSSIDLQSFREDLYTYVNQNFTEKKLREIIIELES